MHLLFWLSLFPFCTAWMALYAIVALLWLIPDRRIERALERWERARE